jgi:hypothetical protein
MGDEERLSGFLDRELAPEDRDLFDAALASDETLRLRAARLRRTDELIRSAASSLADEEVPERFLKVINGALPLQFEGPSVDQRPIRVGNDNDKAHWRLAGAAAASLALGLLLGAQFSRGPSGSLTSDPLMTGLERVASGEDVRLASGARFVPRLTFARKGGGYCREFDLEQSQRTATGLACRSDGSWNIEALVPVAPGASASDGFAVAEGSTAAEVDELISAMRDGDPLGREAETELIRRGWRRAPHSQ